MTFRIFTGAGGHRFVGDTKLGPIVERISLRSGAQVNSHARDQAAAAQLHEIGLHTQAEVIALHAQGAPGYGPANPVKASTHCRYNDGIAYRWWPWGFRIPWWARGIDVDPAHRDAFCAQARIEGFTVTVTYPGSIGEAQHLNFRRAPKLPRPVLRVGSRGRLVATLTKRLRHLGYLPHAQRTFTSNIELAVIAFQRDHHQHADGIAGVHTQRAIVAAVRLKDKELKR